VRTGETLADKLAIAEAKFRAEYSHLWTDEEAEKLRTTALDLPLDLPARAFTDQLIG
jgi:hypothetical protein